MTAPSRPRRRVSPTPLGRRDRDAAEGASPRFPALLACAILAACAPAEPPPPQALALDCTLPYETLAAKVLAQPGLTQAPREPGEPYRFYRFGTGQAAYVLTDPGAPGHPAILRQEAVQQDGRKVMRNTGCPYGDRQGYDQVMAYLESLDG